MVIGDWPVRFKIDTGADVNCIPKGVVDRFGDQEEFNGVKDASPVSTLTMGRQLIILG